MTTREVEGRAGPDEQWIAPVALRLGMWRVTVEQLRTFASAVLREFGDATKDAEIARLRAERDEWQQRALDRDLQVVRLTSQRDTAVADNAALMSSYSGLFSGVRNSTATHSPACNASLGVECTAGCPVREHDAILSQPHPGAALLEEMKNQATSIAGQDGMLAALADALCGHGVWWKGDWHTTDCHARREGHGRQGCTAQCATDRAALRRFGRLP